MGKKVAIIMAMRIEAAPVIKSLNLKPIDGAASPLPLETYQGEIGGTQILLSLNGRHNLHGVDLIGSVPATLNAHKVLQSYKPDLIVSAGTAGGMVAEKMRVGDVFFSKGNVLFHDRDYRVPCYKEHGVGNYPSINEEWLKDFVREHGFKFGKVSSGDSLYFSKEQEFQWEENKGEVKDMEAAAVAFVASLYQVPFTAIKVISDVCDGSKQIEQQFRANVDFAVKRLADCIEKFVSFYGGRNSCELAKVESSSARL